MTCQGDKDRDSQTGGQGNSDKQPGHSPEAATVPGVPLLGCLRQAWGSLGVPSSSGHSMALQGFILVGPTSSRDAELSKKPKGAQSNAPVRTAPYTPTSNTGKKGDPQNSPGGYSLALGLTIEKKTLGFQSVPSYIFNNKASAVEH